MFSLDGTPQVLGARRAIAKSGYDAAMAENLLYGGDRIASIEHVLGAGVS
jgi:hypothetical protein